MVLKKPPFKIVLKCVYPFKVVVAFADTLPPVIPTTGKPTTIPALPPLPGECGVSPVSRVIGGEDSKPGNWPWQVS